jgi:hypothetical protein
MRPQAALRAKLYPRFDHAFENATNSHNGLENFAPLCESGGDHQVLNYAPHASIQNLPPLNQKVK